MKQILISRSSTLIFATLIAVFAVLAGLSGLIYPSTYSPLLFFSGILATGVVIIWLAKPICALYTALILVFIPFGMIPANIQSLLNRSVTVIAAGVWLIRLLWVRKKIVWKEPAIFMFFFLLWSSVTLLWAQNLVMVKFVMGGYTFRFVLFLLLVVNEINSRETFDGLMHSLAIAGWTYVISGIYTLLIYGYEIGNRLKILEENENSLGVLFPVVMVGVIWLASRLTNPRRWLWTYLSLAFILLSFVLIALTGSRGGAISWIITMVVLLFWKQTRLWGIVGLLILVAAFVLTPIILSTTIERFTDRTNDTLLGGREALWQAAWLLIRDHPLTGVGIGNAPHMMTSYIKTYNSAEGYDQISIHNPILTTWAETGLPGVVLYLGILFSATWSFVQQFSKCKRLDIEWLMPYFALTTSALLGYLASWIKGGGLEGSFSYFLLLALLLIPSNLNLGNCHHELR